MQQKISENKFPSFNRCMNLLKNNYKNRTITSKALQYVFDWKWIFSKLNIEMRYSGGTTRAEEGDV